MSFLQPISCTSHVGHGCEVGCQEAPQVPSLVPNSSLHVGVQNFPPYLHLPFEYFLSTRCQFVCLVQVLLVEAQPKVTSNFSLLLYLTLILSIPVELAANLSSSNSAAFCQLIYREKSW